MHCVLFSTHTVLIGIDLTVRMAVAGALPMFCRHMSCHKSAAGLLLYFRRFGLHIINCGVGPNS